MNMIVYFLLGALVCAYWFIWKQANTIASLKLRSAMLEESLSATANAVVIEKDWSTRIVSQCQSQLHGAQAEIRALESQLLEARK